MISRRSIIYFVGALVVMGLAAGAQGQILLAGPGVVIMGSPYYSPYSYLYNPYSYLAVPSPYYVHPLPAPPIYYYGPIHGPYVYGSVILPPAYIYPPRVQVPIRPYGPWWYRYPGYVPPYTRYRFIYP